MWTSKRSDLRAAQSEKDREAVRVSMPVQVLAFYPDTMTVDVQPLVKEAIDGSYGSVYLAVSKTGIAIHGDVDIRGELTTHKRTDSPDGDDGLSG